MSRAIHCCSYVCGGRDITGWRNFVRKKFVVVAWPSLHLDPLDRPIFIAVHRTQNGNSSIYHY